MKTTLTAVSVLAMAATPCLGQQFRFIEDFYAQAASRDGSVLGGWTGRFQPFSTVARWTETGGIQRIGDEPGFQPGGWATVVSGDGLVLGGYNQIPNRPNNQIFRWTGQGTFEGLGAGRAEYSIVPLATSHNGEVMVGNFRSGEGGFIQGAFRWTREGGVQLLENIGMYGEAVAVSADGRTLAGSRPTPDFRTQAILWTEGGPIRVLPNASGRDSRVYGMSSDARFVVGWSSEDIIACVWRDEVPQMLGTLANFRNSLADSISDDGSIITGVCSNTIGPAPENDFVWTAQTGLIGFTVYASMLGYELPMHYRYGDLRVTKDGSMIYGNYNYVPPGGQIVTGTFTMAVPTPGTSVCVAAAFAIVCRRRRIE
jgi:uncharacterized membrane protein